MLDSPELAFLGARGLLVQAMDAGDDATALAMAEKAAGLRPKVGWAPRTLFDLQTRQGLWRDAEATLQAAGKAQTFSAAETARKKALLSYQRGLDCQANDMKADALVHLKAAATALPDRPEIAEAYGRALLAAGKPRQARKSVEAAWATAPSAGLAEIYLDAAGQGMRLPGTGDRGKNRLAASRALAALRPDHPAGAMAVGRTALKADDGAAAHDALTTALRLAEATPEGPAPDLYSLLAEAEAAVGGPDSTVRMGVAKDAAVRRPLWRCDACGALHDHWAARCGSCNAFDQIEAVAPDELRAALPAPAAPPALAADTAAGGREDGADDPTPPAAKESAA